MELSEKSKALAEQNEALLHAIQTGIKMKMDSGQRCAEAEPKHLRVGINAALNELAAMFELLVDAGVIEQEAYFLKVNEYLQREVAAYEGEVSEVVGMAIRLR